MLFRRQFLRSASALAAMHLFPSVADSAIIATQTPGGKKAVTILFQGDSITDGNRGRNEDPNHIMGHGYAFSIASRLGADYPDRNLRFINKGISGNTVLDLSNRWESDAISIAPDVISILAGVNDVYFKLRENKTPSYDFEETYRGLLNRTRQFLPGVLLVLGGPFILPVGMVKEDNERWGAEIKQRQEAVLRLAREFKCVFVDYQHIFSKACARAAADYWIWDGIHPTVAGHELMARGWIDAVRKRLPVINGRKKS